MRADHLLPVPGGYLRPCRETGLTLRHAPGGHHCNGCNRLIHDFRAATATDVAQARATAPAGRLCGRFVVVRPTPLPGLTRRLRCFAVALVLVLGRGLSAQQALAQVRQAPIERAIDLELSELKAPSAERLPSVPPPTTQWHLQSQPQYLDGGQTGMRRFIQQHIRWPAAAGTMCVEGRVYVTFDVGTDGKVYNARVAKSLHPLFDAEALRGVRALGLFKPGIEHDKPVTVGLTVPVEFRIK